MSSRTDERFALLRLEERLAILFLLAGFALRAWLLVARGENYEVDQSVILYWGREYWRGGTAAVFGPEFTRWELLTSYYYGGLDLLGLDARWGAFVLSALEIALTGLLARALWGRGPALIAMALLALLPWHVFYSSIVGTCVAVGIWPLALLAFRWPAPVGILLRALGLWHYSAMRVFLAAEFLWALGARRWRSVAAPLTAFLVFLGATLWLQPDFWRQAFFRGEYVFGTPDYAWWAAVPRGIFFILTPVAGLARGISDMEVGTALADSLGAFGLPLSMAGSILLIVGVLAAVRERKSLAETEKFTLFLIAFSLLSISFAASFTHLLFLVPFLALWMARGYFTVPNRYRGALLLIAGLTLGAESAHLAVQASANDPRDLFSRRIAAFARVLSAEPVSAGGPAKYLLTSQGFIEARYWMDKLGGFRALVPKSAAALEELLKADAGHRDAWVLVDRFVDPALAPERFPEIAAQNRQVEDFIEHLRRRAQVLEERPLEAGAARGILFKIRWP